MFTDRNFKLDICAAIFGIASWISINGIWVELPLMVPVLPESWTLASYLSIIVQIANLGPISYSLVKWKWPNFPKSYAIYVLLTTGVLSSIFLALFWDETTYFNGEERSTALFILVFFMSLVDCTSSVLFMPFMAIFTETYLNSYLVGEGLSGFIPAVVALIQGVGGNPYCDNVTTVNTTVDPPVTETEYIPVYPEPRFSVEVFFSVLLTMMICSLIAFILLNIVPEFKQEYFKAADSRSTEALSEEGQEKRSRYESYGSIGAVPNEGQNYSYAILLSVITCVCFLTNGFLPSIQTYSCLPYGNVIYHLSVTLSSMINPTMAFLAFFLPCRKVPYIISLSALGLVFSGYIIATAAYSPDILGGQELGGTLTVISWTFCSGIFSYVRISIAGWCRQRSDQALFWCGAWTQIGSALGSLLAFILVNTFELFEQYYVTCSV